MTNLKLTKKNKHQQHYKQKQHNQKQYHTNTNTIKHIYIKNNAGFGNKIYDLIFAIYLYNLYNTKSSSSSASSSSSSSSPTNKCIINYVLSKSRHENVNDPSLDRLFPNTKSKINFIYEKTYQNILNNTQNQNTNYTINFIDINTLPKYEELLKHTTINNNFKLVYEMYKTFTQRDKDMFNMNKNSLTDITTLDKITSQPYSLVHIRYGDKLYYLSKNINKPDIDITTLLHKDNNNPNPIDQFILYTPEYYSDKINELLEKTPTHMNIYIITDSANIVKQFIMNQTNFKNNPRIVLLDKMTWWDSFYLLYYATNIVLSSSTFCFAGAYFNKKNAKCDLLLYHHDENSLTIAPEEYALSPSWKISNNRNYILNYNPKIAYIVIKYKFFWTD
jgi:hypothetical protein